MKKTLTLAAAILCAAIPLGAIAKAPPAADPNGDPQRPTGSGSLKQDIKSDAAKTKRALAVAQCNDGRYSYTHHKTCNEHGGIKKRFR